MTNVPDKIIYTAVATSTGGRGGRVVSSDGLLDATLTTPAELGGPGTGTNPEQLFAAGYSACFNSAIASIARKRAIKFTGDSQVTARVGFGPEGDLFALTVELQVRVPGVDRATAEELTHAAHERCPYSRATRGNVPVTLTVLDD